MNWAQVRTIFWLRWCLTRNQWRRSGSFSGLISVLAVVGAFLLAVGSFAGGFMAGRHSLSNEPAITMLIVWDALTGLFVFFWIIGLLTELQRSETIDVPRLMHLPVSLRQVFTINYLASHLTLSVIFFTPALAGLSLGLAFNRPLMALLLPLGASMIFMVSAWTYCLRGWLAGLMVNQRHRRTIVVLITVLIIAIGQVPNLYFNVLRSHERKSQAGMGTSRPRVMGEADTDAEALATFMRVHPYIPVLWLGNGARHLADGRFWPAILGTCGGMLLGIWGLQRAYRGTVRFYHGEAGARLLKKTRSMVAGASPVARRKGSPGRFVALRVHWLPEQAVALALAGIRSMLRAPEVKMTLTIPAIMGLAFGSMLVVRSSATVPELAKPFIATGVGYSALFFTFQLYSNHFGFDRHGFRALVLCPADRKHLLLGKNLSIFPLGFILGLLLLAAASIWLRLGPVIIAATIFQLFAQTTLATMAGNWMSIMLPYRVEPGSVKATKLPAKTTFFIFLTSLSMPLLIVPSFIPPGAELLWHWAGWPAWVPVNLLMSMLLGGLAAFAYARSLEPLGRLLRGRELQILRTVTAEVE